MHGDKKKHPRNTVSLDAAVVEGESITLGEVVPDKSDHFETVNFILDAQKSTGGMSAREKQVLRLRMQNPDITQKEIAESLGITQATVSRRMKNMRKKLLT